MEVVSLKNSDLEKDQLSNYRVSNTNFIQIQKHRNLIKNEQMELLRGIKDSPIKKRHWPKCKLETALLIGIFNEFGLSSVSR